MLARCAACESWPHMHRMRKDTGLDVLLTWQQSSAARIQKTPTLPLIPLCTLGAKAEDSPSSKNGKKRSCCSLNKNKRQSMCKQVRSKSTNPNIYLLWKYLGTIREDSFVIPWYSATSISKYVLLVHASRHHAHPLTWQDSGTCDGPRTFLACREQTKLSVLVADLSVRWRPNETTGDMGLQLLVSKADIHPWDLVCMAMAMCPFLAAHCLHQVFMLKDSPCKMEHLMSCFTYWTRESI